MNSILQEAINTGWGGLDQTETYGTTQHVTSIVGGVNPAVMAIRQQTEDESCQNIEDLEKLGMMGVSEALNISEIPESEWLSPIPAYAKAIIMSLLVNDIFAGWEHTEKEVMGPYIIDHIFFKDDMAVIVNIKEIKGDAIDKYYISMTGNDRIVRIDIRHQEPIKSIRNKLESAKNELTVMSETVHAVSGPVNTVNPWKGSKIVHSEENYELLPEMVAKLVEIALSEKFASKAQARYFFAKAGEKGKEGKKWKKRAKEFASKTDFSKLPKKVKKEGKECDDPGECDNESITMMDMLEL